MVYQSLMSAVQKMFVFVGVWLLAGVCTAGLAAADTGSHFARTLRALERADAGSRADFAGIALWQLTGAYRAEADLARQELQAIAANPKADRQAVERAQQKNRHWSSSVDQYAGRLMLLQRRVEAGAAVDFILSPVTETVLVVEGEQVVLAHPRPGKQAIFEQSVIEQFCQLRDCAALTGPGATAARSAQPATVATTPRVVNEEPWRGAEPAGNNPVSTAVVDNEPAYKGSPLGDQPLIQKYDIDPPAAQAADDGPSVTDQAAVDQPSVERLEQDLSVRDQPDQLPEMNPPAASRSTLRPGWEFTAEGTSCTYGGIRLRFMRGDNSGAVRRLCSDLFAEVAALREGLLQQQQYGVVVEASELAVNPLLADDGQVLLRLNRSGDLLRLPAPLLQANPAVLRNLVPWLEAQLAGESSTLELQAGYYGWQGRSLDPWR